MHTGYKVKFWTDVIAKNNKNKPIVKKNTEAIVINYKKELLLVDLITINNGSNKIYLNVPIEFLDITDMNTDILDFYNL